MKNTRYCEQQGHQQNIPSLICTLENCKQASKWVCADCIIQQIHDHGQLTQNHLMRQQNFLEFIQKQYQSVYDQKKEDKKLIQFFIKELQCFMKTTEFLIQKLEDDLATVEKNYNLVEIQEIINTTRTDYLLLENKQIEKIININNYKKNNEYNLSQDLLKQLVKINQDVQKLQQDYNQKQNVLIKQEISFDNQIIKPNVQLVYHTYFDKQYDEYEEYEQKYSHINTSQISHNEKYLAIGASDCKIQVYDIITKQMIKSIQLNDQATICSFTKDSMYLFCCDSQGWVLCFETNNNFDKKYYNQIHTTWISDIIPIDNDQIITCACSLLDNSIIITNIKQNTQLFQIQKTHNQQINTIDYDSQNDFIISGSDDNSIKFFNRTNGILEFEKQNAHDTYVKKLQLIISDKNNNLISSGQQNLILWYIDYNKKQLTKIKVLEQLNNNFASVANNNRVILIQNHFIQILDQNLSQVQVINHNVDQFYWYQLTRQLNSMNYIIVSGQNRLEVLKKV